LPENISYISDVIFAAVLAASVLCIVHPIPSRGSPAAAGRTGLAVSPVDEAGRLPEPENQHLNYLNYLNSAAASLTAVLASALLPGSAHCRWSRDSGDSTQPMRTRKEAEAAKACGRLQRIAANAIPFAVQPVKIPVQSD
jgi:hypothetical protein